MKLAIIAGVVALLIGFGVGYLMWGERAHRAIEEVDAMKMRQAQQADELRKLKEELSAERDRRQRLGSNEEPRRGCAPPGQAQHSTDVRELLTMTTSWSPRRLRVARWSSSGRLGRLERSTGSSSISPRLLPANGAGARRP